MQPTMQSGTATFSQPGEPVATRAHTSKRARSVALGAGALAGPIAVGAGVAALTGSRRGGWIAGALSLGVLAALRWQLQRWWTDEPAYTVEDRIGGLEIRRYATAIEAHTRVSTLDFETAIEDGFRTLASYIFGGNEADQKLAMTAPVLNRPRATTHTVAFVMPPDRTLLSLPRPHDESIRLVEVPARRVAVLRYRGRYTNEVLREQTQRLHELVAAANLETRGEPIFAGFDPPWTLPFLRRCELWIELA